RVRLRPQAPGRRGRPGARRHHHPLQVRRVQGQPASTLRLGRQQERRVREPPPGGDRGVGLGRFLRRRDRSLEVEASAAAKEAAHARSEELRDVRNHQEGNSHPSGALPRRRLRPGPAAEARRVGCRRAGPREGDRLRRLPAHVQRLRRVGVGRLRRQHHPPRGRVVDDVRGRHGVHVQAPRRRDLPRRQQAHGLRRRLLPRAHARHRPGLLVPVRRLGHVGRGARRHHRRLHPVAALRAVPGQPGAPAHRQRGRRARQPAAGRLRRPRRLRPGVPLHQRRRVRRVHGRRPQPAGADRHAPVRRLLPRLRRERARRGAPALLARGRDRARADEPPRARHHQPVAAHGGARGPGPRGLPHLHRRRHVGLLHHPQRPPTDAAHVRRAIALAFDYDALISILAVTPDLSLGQKVAGPLPNGFPGADPSLPLPERDVAAARAELAQSSYGPSELTMDIAWVAEVPMEGKVALLFQQNLAEIGIDVNIVRVPWTLLTEQAANADTTPHATTVFVSSPFPDPDAQLYSMYHSEAAGTWLSMSWVNDERVDALLNQGRLETDPQERERIYHELQRRLLDIRPAIFGYDQFAAFAHQPNVVVPTLEDHSRSVGGVMGGNWLFRLIEVRDGTRDARSAGGGLAAAATRPAEGEMTNLLSFIGRRLLASLGVLVGESIVIFVIDRVIPGDPARIALGPMASAAQVEALRRQLYLDRPLPLQYYEFVKRSLRGDLGVSLYT